MDPYNSLAELERDGRWVAKEIISGLTAAPSLSRLSSSPCVIQLPVILHGFQHILNCQSKRCSSAQPSILRSYYGNVLDAFLAFATSVWTAEEKAKYESCNCLGHKDDSITEYYRAIKEERGKEMEPLQAIIVRIFRLLAYVFQHIKNKRYASKKAIKETQWPSSPSQLALGSPNQTVTAFVTWARLSKDPGPIDALYGMANLSPPLLSALDDNEMVLSVVADLLRHFTESLQVLDFAQLSPPYLKTLEHTIRDFHQIFINEWFQGMADTARVTKHARIFAPLYYTFSSFVDRLNAFPFDDNTGTVVVDAFSVVGLFIYDGLQNTTNSVSMQPFLVKHTEGTSEKEQWEFWELSRGILTLYHIHQCANINCGSGDKALQIVFKTCSSCKVARYCSKACQVLDWKAHKGVCRGLKVLLLPAGATFSPRASELMEVREAFKAQIRDNGLGEDYIIRMTAYVLERFNRPVGWDTTPAL